MPGGGKLGPMVGGIPAGYGCRGCRKEALAEVLAVGVVAAAATTLGPEGPAENTPAGAPKGAREMGRAMILGTAGRLTAAGGGAIPSEGGGAVGRLMVAAGGGTDGRAMPSEGGGAVGRWIPPGGGTEGRTMPSCKTPPPPSLSVQARVRCTNYAYRFTSCGTRRVGSHGGPVCVSSIP